MITSETKKVYTVNGQEFTSLEEAQASALAEVIVRAGFQGTADLARALIPHADEIVDILTTRPGSLARARKVNGGKKPRKAKASDQLDQKFLQVAAAEAQRVQGELAKA